MAGERYPLVSSKDVEDVFLLKIGQVATAGWAVRRRWRFKYFLPAEVYEAVASKLVSEGAAWIDVGGGHSLFPENPKLARLLVSRCARVVAVDPSKNVLQNEYAHERVQVRLEDFRTDRPFDLATFRMVVEHVSKPTDLVRALHSLLRPGGTAVVFTVNRWTPIALVAHLTPFALHNRVKRLFWNTEEKDTFPTHYKMNSRSTLRTLFEAEGFEEMAFSYLDDLSTMGGFKRLNYCELWLWRLLGRIGVSYPENCLLGVYRKRSAAQSSTPRQPAP